MKTSIITANYNNSKYLKDWLEGITRQTKKPDVVVFTDDQSTDDSWEVLMRLLGASDEDILNNRSEFDCKKFGIHFHLGKTPSNSGPAAARNVSLNWIRDNTKSVVTFVYDSDDVYHPEKISKTLNVFKRFPYIGLVYSDYTMIYEDGSAPKREFKEPFCMERLNQECIISNNSAYATKLAIELGGYDESLFGPEDYDLWIRICERCPAFHIAESLYDYRIGQTNLTVATDHNKLAEHVRKVYEKAYLRRQNATG